jgi:hypothetical protein
MKTKRTRWARCDFVEFDGLLAIVVGLEGEDPRVPEDHIALWFGTPQAERISRGGKGKARPEICLVPKEYCKRVRKPVYCH